MARQIEQVEQDLTKLKESSSQLGRELTAAYRSYFTNLAPTLKQQSIQGCYYLCTTCYPEPFLKLNYDRRSQLLKTLQRVISNAIANLVVQIESRPTSSNRDDDEPTGELTSIPVMPTDWFATPELLSTWQQNLEEELSHSLKEISYKVNLLLQQAQIMPSSIPKPILEASPDADRQGGNTINIPNLLNVLIEQDSHEDRQPDNYLDRKLQQSDEEDDEDNENEDVSPQIIQINSLYLRLTEVEFSDVNVLSLRKSINQLVNKIKALRREYAQKQQELKISQAESAWRNSWFESP
ncbi:hypothetical protein [Chamaesiphon sp. VAR_48_metabat_135_sub]|uniref:hypothetical protein n=1 Tax=Chamaesiphon sp. VAR_48_metabat_135_sub TaxID=2964699 RepID=UPI00286CED85|nr:hypothetical protein [Chamaesiphon sp. VAR_48_metabat_135_sub]